MYYRSDGHGHGHGHELKSDLMHFMTIFSSKKKRTLSAQFRHPRGNLPTAFNEKNENRTLHIFKINIHIIFICDHV